MDKAEAIQEPSISTEQFPGEMESKNSGARKEVRESIQTLEAVDLRAHHPPLPALQ